MARVNQTFRAFAKQLAKHDRILALAFMRSVEDMRSTSQIRAVEAAIAVEDMQALYVALLLDTGFWRRMDAAIENAFRAGAIWQTSTLPKRGPQGQQLAIRFDQRNPRAEEWVRRQASGLITEVLADQRRMINDTVKLGVSLGQGSRTLALDLVGRVQGGKRRGGLVGLHSMQAAAVRAATAELAGDPADMGNYFTRKARDKRFDRTVRKAMREQKRLTVAQVRRITSRYADRLLMVRGERIARTEAHHAFSAGRHEAMQQLVDSGQVPEAAVQAIWQATPGPRTRDTHVMLDKAVVPFGQPFVSMSGAAMRYPGDVVLGAPPEETINCRCGAQYRVDFGKMS